MNTDFEPLPFSEIALEIPPPAPPFWTQFRRRFFHHKGATIALAVLTVIVLFALFTPLLSPYSYYEINLEQKNLQPSLIHFFGTDDLGRDLFTRTAFGARISLLVGISAALIDLVLGILWGGVAALVGGKVDEGMMRLADILYSLPYLLVVVLLMVVLGSGLIPILLAMTFIGWINMARIVRGQLLQLKEQEFVLAAHALGAGFWRILFRHLLPNAFGPILVTLMLTIPSAIFVEAFLSFIGIGIQAPLASLGSMANDGLQALSYYPWRLFFPALFISLTMLAFNLIGDGLKNAFNGEAR